ncbi:hypothetical protein J3L14_10190 [Burkholderia pseudomallei]|uniref:hypothetical protein n=1 Tax=Burkholderia pseudomallei TaxID=28450 RepID=UPI001A9F300B|nr:hypothetical protein [Burkholderia pseudomallei]MBO2975357.1 hypothetical protein [Burkholderia pseudomallei]MBO3059808.1 hypothetical protein [Burkholderia pseudomallei]MBO7829198.1 hypothetical protein [Burkholderia pseudomallei]MBO7860963.1 hypothetical protein [Burkholderia pseudomallei]MBO7890875.1 hypothetical protein [Burkholderia pseudomallei]
MIQKVFCKSLSENDLSDGFRRVGSNISSEAFCPRRRAFPVFGASRQAIVFIIFNRLRNLARAAAPGGLRRAPTRHTGGPESDISARVVKSQHLTPPSMYFDTTISLNKFNAIVCAKRSSYKTSCFNFSQASEHSRI